ncbi:hypothetical protein CGRA01v4_09368 [Colletotrichum graminicola]|uniref:Uncharacterized protein n=1 Tax=Colletotrichum graminicola (strain M1.001 / M2 / FGSC 10212) TaxID=645133 RepID=E3QPB0_COLGM|nr:uncharacterized protein GLRG_07842 [Colletotrichum graminicola M1.001]EFQ32698.1 hypothetical protein GLRG_07842 [Colletotrichum graminicola M1.001]WDK18083.1 hypothetical protein CGRA01v4_09368 [Colletotrichum graminicola]
MQLTTLFTFASLTAVAVAKLHSAAVCVKNRQYGSTGNGTPAGITYGSYTSYEIATDATQCACTHYKNRHTGSHQWDSCPDCHFDGIQCLSDGWHIGGDEMTYYCENLCGSEGAEAN